MQKKKKSFLGWFNRDILIVVLGFIALDILWEILKLIIRFIW